MIEQVMIFALGFLVSGLLTLMFLPAFWRRAMRLSRRRLEMQMPLSMDEIVAERDQLRAEFAAQRRRVERRSEALVAAQAHDRGELGRRARLIGSLDAELAEAKRTVLEQRTALDVAERRIADAEGQFVAANKELFDTGGRLARVAEKAADLDRANKDLTAVAEDRRAVIAAIEARAESLALVAEDLQRQREAAARASAAREADLGRLREELTFVKASATATASKLQTAQAKIEDAEDELSKLRKALDEERRAKSQLEAKGQIAAQSLADAAEREAALRAERVEQAAALRVADENNARQISTLRSENSAVQGALQAARKEIAALRAELATARKDSVKILAQDGAPNAVDDDAMLRQTIKEIGTEVTRLVHTLEDQNGAEATSTGLGELVRALQTRAGRNASSN